MFMRTIMPLLLLCIVVSLSSQAIHSTVYGGEWHHNATWVGGIVPSASDDVVINGPVYLTYTATCNNLEITEPYGVINNTSLGYMTLNVNGSLTNHGTVRNNPLGFTLTVYVGGDLLNYGTFTPVTLYLNGSGAQTISFGEDHPFGGQYLYRTVSAEPIILLDDFYASNCTIHWGNSPLQFSPAASKIVTLNVLIQNASVASTLSHEMHMSETCRIHNLSFGGITNLGYLTMSSNTPVSGELVNHGTIQNWGTYPVMTVDGTLTNYGTISNNPGGFWLTVTPKEMCSTIGHSM